MTQPSTLAELGWKPFFSEQLSGEEAARLSPVRVMAVHRGKIAVAGSGADRLITPSLPAADDEENQATVGDWVLIDSETELPARILRRTSLFKRRPPGKGRSLQLIAANVDTVFIVASCNQDFNVARVERYLVLAREVGVNPVVVLTKIDLTDNPERFADAARGLQQDLPVEAINARDPASAARLATYCGMGESVALLGSSGVGKSTLINTLRGSQSIATQAVREDDGKGRHTTTVRQMHRLEHGGWLIDTPGMRELQLSDAAAGLAAVFDDIIRLALQCRFTNCTHEHEPECAIRAEIAAGRLNPVRLDRWRKLVEEDDYNSAGPGQWRVRAAPTDPAPSRRTTRRG
jgi:ribosome biogenesis GTPase